MDKKLIAVYGTLRVGCSNHHYMKNNGVKLLGTAETKPDFTMTSMGGFPVVKTEGKTPIQIEVYEVENRDSLNSIFNLEGYTGKRGNKNNWYDTVDVDTPFGTADMFIMTPDKYPSLPIIESGDWTKR